MPDLPDHPFVSFELPAVAIPGREHEAFDALHRARKHAIYLNIQFYALAVLDVFQETPDLESLGVSLSGDGDGFIYLDEAELTGKGDIDDVEGLVDGWAEELNDLRDPSMYGFIEALCGNEQWHRDSINQTIEEAYDQLAKNEMMPTWAQVSQRRTSQMQALDLDQATPQPAPIKPSRRM